MIVSHPVVVTGRDGARQFVVALFAKLQVQPGQRAPKGEEIKVTLETDPGESFAEDMRVQLVNPQRRHPRQPQPGRTSGP